MNAPKEYGPGVYPDIDNETYHSVPGISKSGLDLILKSPVHYKARYIDGIKTNQTPAMVIGSAVHTAVLEPEKFTLTYTVTPEINRRTKAGKQEWIDFQEANKGKTILTPEDLELVRAMASSVFENKTASGVLTNHDGGKAEQSFFWEDYASETLCKCRPDFLREDGIVVDLKTTTDASPVGFAKACANFNYHLQAALYLEGVTLVTGRKHNHFIFIAVEKTAPHAVGVYALDHEAIEIGRILMNTALGIYADCRNIDSWPGYVDRIEKISLPAWACK